MNTPYDIYESCVDSVCNGNFKQPFEDIQPPLYLGLPRVNEHTVFLATTEKYSIVIECSQFTSFDLDGNSLANCLRDQYPTATKIQFTTTTVSNMNEMYVIIGFDTESAFNHAFEKEFNLRGKTIYASKGLPKSSKVVYVDISQIPIPYTDEVQNLLVSTLVDYGDILSMGNYVSEDGFWFSGRGYAILIVSKSKQYKKQIYHLASEAIVYGEGDPAIKMVLNTVQSGCPACEKKYKDVNPINRPSCFH